MSRTAEIRPDKSPRPPSRLLALAEGRAVFELAAFYATRPLLAALPRGDGHAVLVLPGFLASDASTVPMRRLLGDLGYRPYGWALGRNVRVDPRQLDALAQRLLAIHRQSGRKVSIIGWSLGGVFARELAKLHPEAVRQVISLGSPLQNTHNYSTAAPLFEHFNGAKPRPVRPGKYTGLHNAPPVPTTSIFTKTDGIVDWRGSVQPPQGQTENIEVHASHLGLGVNPSVMIALADRLRQPEGEWKPFVARLTQRWMFPKTQLN